jgi:hypothetical protein
LLNIDKEYDGNKTEKTWVVSDIPIGNYKINFIALGKKVKYDLKIEEGVKKHLLVNILNNEAKEIVLTWDRTYGGSGYDGASSLIQTTDGGYAVAGWTSSKGAGKSDFWVIKLVSYSGTELTTIQIPTIPVMPKAMEEVTEPSPTIQSGSLSTGTFLVKKLSGGYRELKIENGRNLDAVGVLASSREPKIPLIAVYIQSKDSFTVEGIKDDMYTLYFTLGEDWDSDMKKFTRKTTYARFEDQLEFKTTRTATGIRYTVFTVTLHPVIGGTAGTKPVSEADFPDLNFREIYTQRQQYLNPIKGCKKWNEIKQ